MNNLVNNIGDANKLRTINPHALFSVNKKKIYYLSDELGDDDKLEIPNRYALVRSDTDKPLAVVSNKYKIRSYQTLVEKVNESIFNHFGNHFVNNKITVNDWVSDNGSKFKRDVYFWNEGVPVKDNYKEKAIPHLRIYASYDTQWAEQIIFGSVYVLCMNGLVRPNWQFKVYNKHNTNKETEYTADMFGAGLEAQKTLGKDLFKLMQRKVTNVEVLHLFKNTLAKIAHNLLSHGTSNNAMRELGDAWNKYAIAYGNTMFAVYQTATHWSSHPITRGQKQLVIRRREQKVVDMLNSNYWLAMAA